MVREAIRQYFAPLTERWFWRYAFPVIVIGSIVMVCLSDK